MPRGVTDLVRMLTALIDLFLPPVCLACHRLIGSGDTKRLVCRRCRLALKQAPPPTCARCGAPRLITGREIEAHCQECCEWPETLRSARSAFLMHPPADTIVHQLKYRGWSALAGVMAAPMADAVRACDVAYSAAVIMPVPTTETRLRERGYNQAALIAGEVAEKLKRPCENLLERTSSKSTQTTLQPAARGANVAGAFRLRPDARETVRDAHVLIVDDVLTTGATVIECTQTLVAAGARCASVLTFARAVDTRRLLA
jgi:ComF family protein